MEETTVAVGTRRTNDKPAVEWDIIHEFDPISEWDHGDIHGRLVARVVQHNGRRFLDIRQHHTTPDFQGFTKFGLKISIHELNMFKTLIFPQAVPLLRGNSASCDTKVVTGVELLKG